MPCSRIAMASSGRSGRPNRPPWTLGWSVFTRPSMISGKPVRSETSRTVTPASARNRAVPPVERSSTPSASRTRAKASSPRLSETLSSARAIFFTLPSWRRKTGEPAAISAPLALENPLDIRPTASGCHQSAEQQDEAEDDDYHVDDSLDDAHREPPL